MEQLKTTDQCKHNRRCYETCSDAHIEYMIAPLSLGESSLHLNHIFDLSFYIVGWGGQL